MRSQKIESLFYFFLWKLFWLQKTPLCYNFCCLFVDALEKKGKYDKFNLDNKILTVPFAFQHTFRDDETENHTHLVLRISHVIKLFVIQYLRLYIGVTTLLQSKKFHSRDILRQQLEFYNCLWHWKIYNQPPKKKKQFAFKIKFNFSLSFFTLNTFAYTYSGCVYMFIITIAFIIALKWSREKKGNNSCKKKIFTLKNFFKRQAGFKRSFLFFAPSFLLPFSKKLMEFQ